MFNFRFFLSAFLTVASFGVAIDKHEDLEMDMDHAKKAHGFGQLADSYEKGRKTPPKEAYELITKYVKSGESVLDIGCGTGLSTLPLIEKFASVKGCDWDEKMLKYAKARAPNHFDQASVYHLPYKDQKFGLVTSFASFHWFCDDAAVQEIARVLKPNGYLMVDGKIEKSPKNEGVFGDAEKLIDELVAEKITDPKENYKPIEVLVRNGFEIVEIKEGSRKQEYTVAEAVQYMKSRSIWNDVIKAKKEKVVEERLKALFESTKNSDGKISKISKSCQLIARKVS